MADVAGPRFEDYCAHEEWTEGCIACDYIDMWEYRIDELAEYQTWSEAVRQAEESLGLEGLSDDQKQRYTHELKTALEYKQAWEGNLPALDEGLDSRKAEVDAVCSIGVFVREGQSTKEAQTQGSDEAGVKEAQGSSSATTADRFWQHVVDSLQQRPGFESEDMKQRHGIIQEKLEDLVLDLDDKKLGLGSPLDYYDGEPILLTTLKELEKEEKEAQKEQ
ncbi:hypothetical protein KC345_g7374 [Hortaea werneckii]|nr:hypothetical protein KC345_g7374 [Hortaea werneckii]